MPTVLGQDPSRLYVRYAIAGDVDAVAEAIRVEQTIEFPADLAPEWIQEEVVGRVEERDEQSVVISYAAGVYAGGLGQVLNVLWGNVSLFEGVRVVGVQLPAAEHLGLRGPRFGGPGVRSLLGVESRPLLATALKPMGSTSAELAATAGVLAEAGIDLIKDDHSLGDQPWSPWRERVARCAEAVREANARAGTSARYLPSLNVPAHEVLQRAHEANELGAEGLLVLPGITGFDAMRALADDDDLALPIMSHPSMLGSHVVNPGQGLDHGILLGLVNRLAGADMVVFPNYGGRFGFSVEQCARIRDECAVERPGLRSALPTPGGGMTLARVPEILDLFGHDVVLLIGGALHRGDLSANATALREAVEMH
ncbi:RuBisCO large subunit C-terminal-like domain-containing protein [Ornithinimicrobium cavernae]|uniref:RuBisCO large subunit C-terminal-like domain-containing protein n=1 Tax=Ornithinimicrobium cavernae TaxID=2666047 RepID=UPI000D6901D3|nr:RuBisCO large subunit C-terminal-like domain-containing protein [Ornithinimicrobium cavernae]